MIGHHFEHGSWMGAGGCASRCAHMRYHVPKMLLRLRGGIPSVAGGWSEGHECRGEHDVAQVSQEEADGEEGTGGHMQRYGPSMGGMVGCWTGLRRGDVVALDATFRNQGEETLLRAYLPDALFFRHHFHWFLLGVVGGFSMLFLPMILQERQKFRQLQEAFHTGRQAVKYIRIAWRCVLVPLKPSFTTRTWLKVFTSPSYPFASISHTRNNCEMMFFSHGLLQ